MEPDFVLNVYAKSDMTTVVASGTPEDGATLTGIAEGTEIATGTYVSLSHDTNGVYPDSLPTDVPGFTTLKTVDPVIPVSGVSMNEATANGEVGTTITLTATVTPDNATNSEVTWASSDTSIATVDSTGKVTLVAAGTANITATAGDQTGTTAVTVAEPTTS